ncbi:MAG: DUF4199 domain-containing protein [Bacteroidales bacterium]|nr:DUF4199 domain-containing protein [Bacteroidales bacterium]MBR4213972.1 DUF4199 domain-containing protein [Bacteroidales bacterium]
MQKPAKIDFLRHALTYGAYTGIGMTLAMFITELITKQISFGGIIVYIALSSGILFGQKVWSAFRKPDPTPFMQLTLYGIVCGIGATIIASLYLVVDLKFVHTSALDTITEQSMEMMKQMKAFSEQDLQNAAGIIEALKIPITIISYFTYNLFIIALFSLFSAWISQFQKK